MEGAPLMNNQVAPEPGGDGASDAPSARGNVGKMSTVLHAMTLQKAGAAAGSAYRQPHPAGVSIQSLGGKAAKKIAAFDDDHDGQVSTEEMQRIVEELINEEVKSRNMKRMTILMGIVVVLVILANIGLAFGVAILAKDTAMEGDVMVSKSTGKTVEMASSDYAMEGGILISRASLTTENGTTSAGLDPAVRRLLLQDDEVSVDDDGTNGPYASPIVTAALTDASGALLAGDGSDATCARATYFEDPSEFPEGWMSLFDMEETALSAIEGLSLEDEDGGNILNLRFDSVDTEKMYLDETVPGFEFDDEDLEGQPAVMEVHRIFMYTPAHPKYAFVLLTKLTVFDRDSNVLSLDDGNELVMKGDEGEHDIMADLVATQEGGEGRKLLGLKKLKKKLKKEFDRWKGKINSVEKKFKEASKQLKKALDEVKDLKKHVSDATGKITEYAGKIADLTEQVAKKVAEAAEFKELWEGMKSIKDGIEDTVGGLENIIGELTGFGKDIEDGLKDFGDFFADLPGIILDELKKVDWIPISGSQVKNVVEDLLSAIVPLNEVCIPIGKLLKEQGVPRGEPKELLQKGAFTLTTTIEDLAACFQISDIKINFDKMGDFLLGILDDALEPLIKVGNEIKDFFEDLIDQTVGQAMRALEKIERFFKENLSLRRRRLLGKNALASAEDLQISPEELREAVLEHLRGAAQHFTRSRILAEQGLPMAGPDMYPTEGDHPMAGIHKLAQTMHSHGFRQMHEVFNEAAGRHMDRRRLADSWGEVFGMDSLEFKFLVDYEQKLTLTVDGSRLVAKSGDLLDLFGIGGKLPINEEKILATPFPGMVIKGRLFLGLELPWEILVDAGVEAELTISLKNMYVSVNVMTGELEISGGDMSESGLTLNAHIKLGGMVGVELKIMAVISFCFGPKCIDIQNEFEMVFGTGFDMIAGVCVEACDRYTDEDDTLYFNTWLTDDVSYPDSAHSCIGDITAGGFIAGGMWMHLPEPRAKVKVIFPDIDPNLLTKDWEGILPAESPNIVNYNPNFEKTIFSETFAHFCQSFGTDEELPTSGLPSPGSLSGGFGRRHLLSKSVAVTEPAVAEESTGNVSRELFKSNGPANATASLDDRPVCRDDFDASPACQGKIRVARMLQRIQRDAERR